MIDWLILVAIGILFIVIEMMSFGFFFLFFGISFILVGLLSLGVALSWQWQILLAVVLALVLLVLLKKPIKRWFNKNGEVKDNFLDDAGVGIVKEGMIEFKGTFWKHDDMTGLSEGDRVQIDGVRDGKLVIRGKI